MYIKIAFGIVFSTKMFKVLKSFMEKQNWNRLYSLICKFEFKENRTTERHDLIFCIFNGHNITYL